MFKLQIEKVGVLGVLALCLVACAAETGPDDDIDTVQASSQAIINGTQSTWNSAIVGVKTTYADGAIERCTGTMVNRYDVLTAAHCVMKNSTRVKRVDVAFGANWNDKLVLANWYTIYPACDVDGCVTDNDMALLSFNNPVSGVTAAPIAPFAMPAGSFVGNSIVMVGFGAASSDGRTGAGVKRWAYGQIADNTGGELEITGSNGADICTGDSGGPILRSNGSVWQIVGVISGGVCGSGTSYAAMPTAQAQFIDDNLTIGSISQP